MKRFDFLVLTEVGTHFKLAPIFQVGIYFKLAPIF